MYPRGNAHAVPLHRSLRRRPRNSGYNRAGLPDRQGGIQNLRQLDTNDLKLEAGTYYLSGIVTDQPAALRITVKDKAYDNATTAEELYNAMQKNRTVSKTYYFNTAQPAEQPIAKNPVVIPKTGDISIIAYAIPLSLIGFGLFVAGKRR